MSGYQMHLKNSHKVRNCIIPSQTQTGTAREYTLRYGVLLSNFKMKYEDKVLSCTINRH